MEEFKCAKCGIEIDVKTLNFTPTTGRPLYCAECYRAMPRTPRRFERRF
jgi:CxxC-x17-CxxC domain-containing protein